MIVHLSFLLAQQLADDRLRAAQSRRRVVRTAAGASVGRRRLDAHQQQRLLVRASLLLGAGRDEPTQRRWA